MLHRLPTARLARAATAYVRRVPEGGARITRGEWFDATDSGDIPDEYMPAFH